MWKNAIETKRPAMEPLELTVPEGRLGSLKSAREFCQAQSTSDSRFQSAQSGHALAKKWHLWHLVEVELSTGSAYRTIRWGTFTASIRSRRDCALREGVLHAA